MESIVCHYTAGAYGGDYAVGKDGYFNFYCPRDLPAVQFAEGDALTWHAGEWNDQGPGIELERRDDSVPYTDHQLAELGRIVHWLHDRYGLPLDRFYDTGGDNGARLSEGQTIGRAVTHRSLSQSGGWHSDYLTPDEWHRAVSGVVVPTPPVPMRENEVITTAVDSGTVHVFMVATDNRVWTNARLDNGAWTGWEPVPAGRNDPAVRA
jgi:hypothetical protein